MFVSGPVGAIVTGSTLLVIASASNHASALAAALDESMGVQVRALEFNERLPHADDIDQELQNACLLSIGAALRLDLDAVAA